MRLLITNDDGINAPRASGPLVERAIKHPDIEVTVVAPDRERSATGHAISIHQPIDLREVPFDSPRARVFASSGTLPTASNWPSKGSWRRSPTSLISGINRGPNLGTDVFYSGTVSAALEGALPRREIDGNIAYGLREPGLYGCSRFCHRASPVRGP